MSGRGANGSSPSLDAILHEGFEQHYALVWHDVRQELVELSRLLSIPCVTF